LTTIGNRDGGERGAKTGHATLIALICTFGYLLKISVLVLPKLNGFRY
jgi:hypothetical protein